MVVIVELRLGNDEQTVVFPCVTPYYSGIIERPRPVRTENLLVHSKLKIHQLLFIKRNICHDYPY